jgi:hypothetical protein
MLAKAKAKMAAMYRSLTRTGEEQPLHKLALAVVLLLDVFILVSIFDGLDVQGRQLDSPGERLPQVCRTIVIDRTWTTEVRLDRLAAAVSSRRSVYRDPERREPDPLPLCARVLSPLYAVAAQDELGELLEQRERLGSELRDSETALAREKGAYDTHLLSALANPRANRPEVEAIVATVQHRTAAIEAARARLAGIDAVVRANPQVVALWSALDALGASDAAALASEERWLERWYEVKLLAMQLLFLLPLLGTFAVWHGVSARRGRGLQALVAAHLVVVAAIPLIFRIAEAVYEVLPKRFLKRFIELLVSLKLVAIWHYLVIALGVAAALATVFTIQRWLFSRERLLERRIAKGECQRCGKRLPAGAPACPFCGFGQRRACASCGGRTAVHAPFCSECGAPATAGDQ